MNRRPPAWLPSLTLSLCLFLVVLAGLPGDAFAVSIKSPVAGSGSTDVEVVEHLRVQVAAGARQAWQQAEQEAWEPWLQQQEGFLGRELLWDAEKEEGILLIHWRTRKEWLAIPETEIEAVQRRFEAAARRALGLASRVGGSGGDSNPFPLVFAGELEVL